jgi:predicted nucleotidyltransferase
MIDKSIIKMSKHKLAKFCKKNHIKKLSFFGSVLSKNFTVKSDIDILVEFDPAKKPGLFNLIRLEDELSSIFYGHKIDLRTPMDISRYFRNDVLKMAEVIYVET